MDRMKIAVVGPGAMGCFFAARLAKGAENEVWLIDKHCKSARSLDRRGIRISGLSKTIVPGRRVRVVARAARAGVCDAVLILVKSYDTRSAALAARPLVGSDTFVVTLQNGFGNVEAIRAALPGKYRRNVTGGITAHGVTLLAPGWVRHAGRGYTAIGFDDAAQREKAKALAGRLNQAGIETDLRKGTAGLLWSKVVINSAINPLAAVLRVPNGELVRHPGVKRTLLAIVEESAKVVRAAGVRLPYASPRKRVVRVCNMTAVNVNSMLQDILGGRRTEVDAINGAVVRQAQKLRMSVPLNVACWRIVRSIEVS